MKHKLDINKVINLLTSQNNLEYANLEGQKVYENGNIKELSLTNKKISINGFTEDSLFSSEPYLFMSLKDNGLRTINVKNYN